MTTTAWKQADGSKRVQWTSLVHTRISNPNAIHPHFPNIEDFDPDQHHPDRGELSAEPSIYTLDIDDPWAKKSILSLDGGGVRNFSSLLILQELMRAVGEHERQTDPSAKSSAYSPLVNCVPDGGPTSLAGDTGSALRYLPCH